MHQSVNSNASGGLDSPSAHQYRQIGPPIPAMPLCEPLMISDLCVIDWLLTFLRSAV